MEKISIQQIFSRAYQPFYLSFLTVCLIISFQVYGRIQSNIGRKSENTAFRRIILTYVVYIVDDMLWLIFYTDSSFTMLTSILEYCQTGILAAFTFFWFLFAEYYIDGFPVKNGRLKPLFYLPLIAAVLTTIFFCLNLVGVVGDEVIPSAYLYNIDSSIDFFYLAFAFFHTLMCLIREKRRTRRRRYRVILECILYPAVGAIVSLFVFYVPFIILGILPSIIKVLIEMQNANIYTDALTGINNRYRVNEYLEREWGRCSERTPLIIYLIDINKFKGINDRYGHLEGDRALVAVADSLKKVASEGIIIGRFGGDEFILVDALDHDPERIQKELRDNLAEAAQKQKFPFSLTISVGYALCTDPSAKVAEVLAQADAELYQDKRRSEK